MWKYKVTYTFTRRNTTILWEDPNSEYDFIYQLGESFSRNILVDEKLSDDNLCREIIWLSPDEETWVRFEKEFRITDSNWNLRNEITTHVSHQFT